MKKSKKAHPGFKAVAKSVAKKEGVSPKKAGAIVAAGARNASAKAKKDNPRLGRVAGAGRGPGPAAGGKGMARRKKLGQMTF